MQSLKAYGISYTELRRMCRSLNRAQLTDTIQIGKFGQQALMFTFLDAIEAIPENLLLSIPDDVRVFYTMLPDAVFEDFGKEVTDENSTSTSNTVESSCKAFLFGWNPDEYDCQNCKVMFPREYTLCKDAVGMALIDRIEAYSMPTTGNKSRYGSKSGTMAACIDDLLWYGGQVMDIEDYLMNSFGKPRPSVHSSLLNRIRKLHEKGVTVIKTNTYLKATTEYAEGLNSENTIPIIREIQERSIGLGE